MFCNVSITPQSYYIISNTVTYGHALLTFYGEVDSLRRHSSFIHGDALVPAGLIRAHRGHLKRQVGQHVHSRIRTCVVAPSQPGEVEADGADNVAREDGAGARGHRDVPLHCDGWRRLCGKKAEAIDQSINGSINGWMDQNDCNNSKCFTCHFENFQSWK